MKKLLGFLGLLLTIFITQAQTPITRSETVQATLHLQPPSDTVLAPNGMGEIRYRIVGTDTTVYIAISTTAPKKWSKFQPLLYNQGSVAGDGTAGSPLRLANDITSPGIEYSYKTNPFGNKGWFQGLQFYSTIYNKNTWADLSDFTNNTTASVVGGKIQVFPATTGTYTQTLSLTNFPTALEHYTAVVDITVDSINATSYGFGIGVLSANSYGSNSFVARTGFYGSPNDGKILFDNYSQPGPSFQNLLTTTRNITAVKGNHVLLQIERNENIITTTISNSTTNSSIVDTSYSYNFSTPYIHNTGRFTIFAFGNQFTINSINISSKELRNAELMVIGDSKTQGFNASSFLSRYGNLMRDYYKSVVVSAGGYDRTTEVLLRLNEIKALNPKRVILAIGSNDPRSGMTQTQFQTNYKQISDSLLSYGVDVYYALPFYETSQDLTFEKTYINSTFAANKIIDTWTPMSIPGSLSSDGIHPNDVGHKRISDAIINSFRISVANPFGTNGNVLLQTAFKQNGGFNVAGPTYIGGPGNNGKVVFRITGETNQNEEHYSNGGIMYSFTLDDARVNAVDRAFVGNNIYFSNYSGSNYINRGGMDPNGNWSLTGNMTIGGSTIGTVATWINTAPRNHFEYYNFSNVNYVAAFNNSRDTSRDWAMWGNNILYGTSPAGSSTFTERMRVANSGQLLVGTTSPIGAEKARVFGKLAVDTLATGVSGTDSIVVWNSVSKDFRKIAPGSGGGTTTYFINSKLGDTTFRTTGPGLAANTIQWKGLIPGNGMNSVTTDSTIKYNWGGTLANATTINNNGFGITYSGTGTIAISGGNYNGSLGSTWQMNGATINNAVTAASGTVAKVAQASIGGSTWTASNTGVTYTNAATFYVDGPPTAGTNVTITNPYSLFINGGNAGLFHIRGTTGAPTVAVGTAGAGTVSCQNCTDIAGTVTFTMTSSVSFPTQASIFSVTFANPYLRAPNVVFSSNNIDAAFAAAYPYTKNVTTTGFSIAVQNAGTAAATTSSFTYHVIE